MTPRTSRDAASQRWRDGRLRLTLFVPLNLFSGGEQDFPPELRDNLRAIAYRAIYAHVEGLRSDAELNADRGGADAS